jgi:hypothetical protein
MSLAKIPLTKHVTRKTQVPFCSLRPLTVAKNRSYNKIYKELVSHFASCKSLYALESFKGKIGYFPTLFNFQPGSNADIIEVS